eukprot:s864_g14.t2
MAISWTAWWAAYPQATDGVDGVLLKRRFRRRSDALVSKHSCKWFQSEFAKARCGSVQKNWATELLELPSRAGRAGQAGTGRPGRPGRCHGARSSFLNWRCQELLRAAAATRFFRHTEGGNAEPACPSRMVTFANDHDRTWLDGPVAGGLSLFVSGASAEGLPARLGHLRPVPEVPEKTPPPRARGEPEVGEEAGSSEQHSIDMESEGQSGSAQSLGDEPRIEAAKAEAAEMHRSLHHKVAMAAAAVRAAADAAKVAQKERKCTVSPSSTLIDRAEETQGKTTHLVSTSTQTSLSIAAQTTQTSTYVSNAPASWKAQTYVAPLPRSFSVPPPPKVMVAPPRHSTNAAWTPGHPQVLPLPQSPRAVHTPRTPCSTPGTPMPVRWS